MFYLYTGDERSYAAARSCPFVSPSSPVRTRGCPVPTFSGELVRCFALFK
jgi:hypothetical protein